MRVDKMTGTAMNDCVIEEINAEIERMEEDGYDVRIISIKTENTEDCYTTYEVWFEMREKND